MRLKSLQSIFLYSLVSFGVLSHSLPLSTHGKLIVDSASGKRVKLACTCWASHLQPMLAEGLDKQPLKDIVAKVVQQRFTCVRLTWATYMFTRYKDSTVTQTLDSLNLTQTKEGIAKNNPEILKMTHVQAYETAVDELGKQGLMVVLDNHVSSPQWCCGNDDGNGFFGDTYFDPEEWRRGLDIVAQHFQSKSQMVAVSLRNELRGPRQNEADWYKYIEIGVATVHQTNPNVLVIVSGLNYATDLSFLKNKPLENNFDKKLVYESHWYSWTVNSEGWHGDHPLNKGCAEAIQVVFDHSSFVTGGAIPGPLFLGEFGIDQRGTNDVDNRFIDCFMAYAAKNDLDWSLWALQGSYYLREGQSEPEEVFGVLNANWDSIRNPDFMSRLQVLQRVSLDPSLSNPTSYAMFHPESGSCVQFSTQTHGISADDSCQTPATWNHDHDGAPLRLTRTNLCLKVVGDGLAPVVSTDCSSQQSLWDSVSPTKFQLAAKDANGQYLCLEKASNSSQILTKKCICIDDACSDDPRPQWFPLVSGNPP